MKIEIRSDGVNISGYVNAAERYSELLAKEKGEGAPGAFREKIRSGAFGESLRRLPDVPIKFNHAREIGRTGANLTLREDSIGLHADVLIDDEETVNAAKAGRLRGWSFGMQNVKSSYRQVGEIFEREVEALDLTEVSLLTKRPAYSATSIELRDGEPALETRVTDDLQELTPEELEKINVHTRRDLTAAEVYAFPVVLCDNEIDRDGERFSAAALEKLSGLFVGRTGIFDHDPKGRNQTARIYDCSVVTDPDKMTSFGEPYRALTAKAYIVRTDSTRDLIAEIDGGIKKEVSVSCSVGRKLCSVCGSDVRDKPCGHVKGREYDGKVCTHILDEPGDAYEWSFVAVPAQPKAGVTKTLREPERSGDNEAILAAKGREIEILKMKGKMNSEH